MVDNIKKMKKLIQELNKASYAYYGKDSPIMSDKEYDALYDELMMIQKETGTTLAGSPTQKVQGYVLDGFTKVTHSKPMLSANKTKDINDIIKFLRDYDWYCSYKLDGLTLVLRYNDGKFVQGITRGNGIIGEDVTEQCKFIDNIPMTIPNKHFFEVRGECVMSWNEFKRVNSTLDTPYSNPRNLAAGTLRNLDLNILKQRKLSFVVFEMVHPSFTWKTEELDYLDSIGFETVRRLTDISTSINVSKCVEKMKPEYYEYPVDGLIFEVNNKEISKQLGSTSHHENCRMALKWKDETYPTKLINIEWTIGKTGVLTPTIVTEPVEIDGTIVNRASVHNVSIFKQFRFTKGCTCNLYKANMIIPQCDSVENNYGEEITIPDKCPICGGETKIVKENDSEVLMCMNDDCQGKLLGKLSNAVSRNALNVDNLSEATLEKFISLGWLNSIKSIYHLSDYKGKMYSLEGFGKKSVDKLLESIEKSRETTLDRFIYALSVPLIGKSASKDIAKHFKYNFGKFYHCFSCGYGYFWNLKVDGIGVVASNNIQKFAITYMDKVFELSKEFTFKIPNESNHTQNTLQGKTFVITGSLEKYSNRDELKSVIESYGGKVSGSVSAKTFALINNDIESSSSKNKKAKSLGVQIINEEQFMQLIGE
ncbi:NAD-dependent DNA ligase LigA [Blautia massiliensis (ex Durand et al. 2017)]|jgi:DNA ligase (NAD+)|uniref:NAD-dependent DNA ligase LigA n=1 Tax=Blautia massiliensis (ex Durand et al. 2017) TaxID=1737424 RepID=UPI001570E016|nr:NAD-dependent DNA ligase LigA [Blautia massiliensis (ex Durand et al. 2017)]NSK75323.1 NAD-dependent DNA ligase LigA [Blautia massiliensis (ex Durand et al. 2017)]